MATLTATYSPEDNKLRLYASSRLDSETYDRVKAAGFKWAPKQNLFVAPMWTTRRADLLIELCGEIEDEDKSLVDRAEERSARFEDYKGKRTNDAERAHAAVSAITDNIPFGQPILVGHHSERHARKDAQRIENGMRKAVQMWDTAEYWKSRAAGAIAHAKHKERPDVRARRIKSFEAEKRKIERNKAEAEKWLAAWSKEGLTFDEAVIISGSCWLHLPRKEGDRPDFNQQPTAYDGLKNTYPSLYAPRSVDEIVEQAKRTYPTTIEKCDRWISHYENRLIYERAMLAEQGGTAADKFKLEVGGRILVRGEWVTIMRINKSGGQITSVTTNARYVRVRGVEEIIDYQAPDAAQAAKVKAATKLAPLCNYAGDGFHGITQAEWDKINKDYKGTRTIEAANGIERHRVRVALGLYGGAKNSQDWSLRHAYGPVFISDAKTKTPAKIADEVPAIAPEIPAPERVTLEAEARKFWTAQGVPEEKQNTLIADIAAKAQPGAQVGPFTIPPVCGYQTTATTCSKPNHAGHQKIDCAICDTGTAQNLVAKNAANAGAFHAMREQLKQGVQVVSAPQLFPTPPALAARMVGLADIKDGMTVLEPSAGTGRILQEIMNHSNPRAVVAVEINNTLADRLRNEYPLTNVHAVDFLQYGRGDYPVDRILMNPPYENAADINHIKHAITILKPGGKLVALCANGPRQNEQLRPLADVWEVLPPGSFVEAGTMVNVALLVISG